MEADSLNASILGEDAVPGTEEFDLFIKEVQREITVKAGQKCTAVRRIIVPEKLVEDVQIALGKRLAATTIGDPSVEGVRMGSLAGQEQLKEVREKVTQLAKSQQIVFGDLDTFEVTGADKNKGAFMSPILFLNNDPFNKTDCHNVEAFGPVSTIMPYKDLNEAIKLANMGKGSLVCSIVTNDDKIAQEFVLGAAPMHGRILILNAAFPVNAVNNAFDCLVDRRVIENDVSRFTTQLESQSFICPGNLALNCLTHGRATCKCHFVHIGVFDQHSPSITGASDDVDNPWRKVGLLAYLRE